jgi:hypothetical protein
MSPSKSQTDLKGQIATERRGRGDAFEKRDRVLAIIRRSLASKAEFLYDGNRSYLHHRHEHLVLPIGPDSRMLQIKFWEEYGLLLSEPITREILEALHVHALGHGRRVQLHRLGHYDVDSGTLYVSDLGRQMLVIPPTGWPTIQANGHHGVLFVHDERWEPIPLSGAIGDSPLLIADDPGFVFTALLDGITFVEGSPEEQGFLLVMWTLGLFFPELFPTKPILTLLGEAGSGKTAALRRIGMLLFGPRFNVTPITSSSKDFDAAATNESLVVLDNLDARRAGWLSDRLCTAATGGTVKMRALFKDNVQME